MNKNSTSEYAFLFEYLICENYKLSIPEYFFSEYLVMDGQCEKSIKKVIPKVFECIGANPIKLLSYSKETNQNGNLITSPHDFLLENGKTLSIKFNMKSGNTYKVSPRVVGQAGYNVLNNYFEKVYGKRIETQLDIKKLFLNNIDHILPVFIEKLFVSDYTLFIQQGNEEVFFIIDRKKINIPVFEKSDIIFIRNLEEWNEANIIKYMDKTIAEVQTHKYRTFKFRFHLKNLLEFIYNSN